MVLMNASLQHCVLLLCVHLRNALIIILCVYICVCCDFVVVPAGWLTGFLDILGGAYAACALFNIGIFMVGKLKKLTGTVILVATLLIVAKTYVQYIFITVVSTPRKLFNKGRGVEYYIIITIIMLAEYELWSATILHIGNNYNLIILTTWQCMCKFNFQSNYDVLCSCSIILPLIAYRVLYILLPNGVNNSTASQEDIATFGFLLGTFPTAPTVFVFASQYFLAMEVVSVKYVNVVHITI